MRITKLIQAISFLFLLTTLVGILAGCTVIWHDDVFVLTLFKEVDANDLNMNADSKGIRIGSGDSETKNNKVSAAAIVGGVPVKIETK